MTRAEWLDVCCGSAPLANETTNDEAFSCRAVAVSAAYAIGVGF